MIIRWKSQIHLSFFLSYPAYFDRFVNFVVHKKVELLEHHIPLHHEVRELGVDVELSHRDWRLNVLGDYDFPIVENRKTHIVNEDFAGVPGGLWSVVESGCCHGLAVRFLQ